MNGLDDDLDEDVTRSAEVTRVLSAAMNALREAAEVGNDNAKLLAIRNGAKVLTELDNDTGALDHLSAVAADIYDITPDTIQDMLALGVQMGEAARASARARARHELSPGIEEEINRATEARSARANGNGYTEQEKAPPPKQKCALLKSARASTFKMTTIQWLWPDRFALGKLGLLVGLPDEGKGQIFADMAARVTRGNGWPCNEGTAPQGNVIMLGAEDDPNDTVVPRLKAADADLDCIEIVSMVRADNKDRMFSLVTDLPLLRQKIIAVGNVKLILIDPISAYLGIGKIDSFRTTDVRAVLGPLIELAGEFKVAIIGIMHFNKKIDVTNALLRISDSMAFGATARHVYAAVDDAENKRKLMVKGKNNLAKSNQKALAYNFGECDVGEAATGRIMAPHILWHAKHVDVTASEAMQASKSPAARDDAKKFLADMLASGPVPKRDIEEAADANGIAERTLFRAKSDLQVTAKKDGDNGAWRWHLLTAAKPGITIEAPRLPERELAALAILPKE